LFHRILLDKGVCSACFAVFEFVFDDVLFEVRIAAPASILGFGADRFDSVAFAAHAWHVRLADGAI
jgi:hypothetical protein